MLESKISAIPSFSKPEEAPTSTLTISGRKPSEKMIIGNDSPRLDELGPPEKSIISTEEYP